MPRWGLPRTAEMSKTILGEYLDLFGKNEKMVSLTEPGPRWTTDSRLGDSSATCTCMATPTAVRHEAFECVFDTKQLVRWDSAATCTCIATPTAER